MSEFYAAATGKLKLDPKDAAARAAQLIAGFDTFGYSVHAVRAALYEAPKGRFSYWDSVLLASAAEAGCTTIFSEDMADGARFGSIAVANPFRRNELAPHAQTILGLGESVARSAQDGLSQRVRPEVAGPMTGSAKPTRIFPVYQNAWARRSAPLPTLRAFTSSSST